jgi:hypothetical protein
MIQKQAKQFYGVIPSAPSRKKRLASNAMMIGAREERRLQLCFIRQFFEGD